MLIYEPYVSNMYAILATCEWAKQLSRCLPRIKVGLGKSVNKQTVKSDGNSNYDRKDPWVNTAY